MNNVDPSGQITINIHTGVGPSMNAFFDQMDADNAARSQSMARGLGHFVSSMANFNASVHSSMAGIRGLNIKMSGIGANLARIGSYLTGLAKYGAGLAAMVSRGNQAAARLFSMIDNQFTAIAHQVAMVHALQVAQEIVESQMGFGEALFRVTETITGIASMFAGAVIIGASGGMATAVGGPLMVWGAEATYHGTTGRSMMEDLWSFINWLRE